MDLRLRRRHVEPHAAEEHARGKLPKLGALALLAPVAYLAAQAHMPLVAFPTSVLALVGGAFLLGEAAEVAAGRLGEGVGALVTATLSNLVTLTIVGAALFAGLYDVVRASIIGAILGNILFALGGAMLLGGLKREKQSFGKEAAAVNATLLIVASFAFLLPAVAEIVYGARDPRLADKLTVPMSAVLLLTYIVGLLFSTKTHKHLFNPVQRGEATHSHPLIERYTIPALVFFVAIVAVMAETLAENIEPVGEAAGIPTLFLGLVVIGIITNSVEIATAFRMARKDRMHVALQTATGSGIQVMLFVTPLLVLLSLLLPFGQLSLEFPITMVVAVAMAALIVNIVVSDGESTWYEGLLLLALYAMFGMLWFLQPV